MGRWASAVTLLGVLGLCVWLMSAVRLGVVFSDSMNPTLTRGDVYLIRVDAYRRAHPRHGDIVVIKHPEDHEVLIKRVVGVAGDNIGVLFGRVWINGAWLAEPYIPDVPGVREKAVAETVPTGRLFLLGDNRNYSGDSRDMGPLPVAHVIGRAVAVIYPWRHRRKLPDPGLQIPSPPQTW